MATVRRLANNSLKKTGFNSSMGDLVDVFAALNDKPEAKVEDLPPEIQSNIHYIKDEDLLDDPMNEDFYGELEVDGLTYEMKQHGFQGVILAYPLEDRPGKYMIESGHRRRLAGRNAGVKEFPVFITETPKFAWQRTIRLTGANLHGRPDLSPLKMANLAEKLFLAYKEELNYKRKNGLLKNGDVTVVNELVARALEMTRANVEKYRRLLKLEPRLQKMADNGTCPWSFLAEANTLPKEKQIALADMIDARKDEEGSSKWVLDAIKEMKTDAQVEFASGALQAEKTAGISDTVAMSKTSISENEGEPHKEALSDDLSGANVSDTAKASVQRSGRPKGKNGLKKISSSVKGIYEALQDDYQYKESEAEAAVKILLELQDKLPELIEQMKSK